MSLGRGPGASGPARNQAFQSVRNERPRRSVFDLSHEKKMTIEMGHLVPTMVMEMVPGDSFEISNDIVCRLQPMFAPLLHQVDLSVHYFFVPTRLCWPKIDDSGDDWESFITRGMDGDNAANMPRWNVSSGKHDIGSLWDYFGFPTWSTANDFSTQFGASAVKPLAFPLRAYNLIFNEFYRDETIIDEVDLDQQVVMRRCWTKDYFTSALPFQQRGTAPAFTVGGSSQAVWAASRFEFDSLNVTPVQVSSDVTDSHFKSALGGATDLGNMKAAFDSNTVDLSGATTFDIADFRMNAVLQRLMERNARGGARYTEYLQNVFGVHPRDDRLQRPEYVGGVKQPIIFSEVLQQSATDGQPTPQGNMAGHGISVGRNYVGRYTSVEFGYMIGILSIMPVPAYQDGVPRMYLRESAYDFYVPEFANLSEQAVLNEEVYLGTDNAVNRNIFGYQGRFNELRYERSSVHGLFRSTLDYWHLGRIFSSRPALNDAFVQLGSTEGTALKRVFSVTGQPPFLASIGNRVRAIRPLPEFADPGIYRV